MEGIRQRSTVHEGVQSCPNRIFGKIWVAFVGIYLILLFQYSNCSSPGEVMRTDNPDVIVPMKGR
jgi:hypothetical protein